MLFSSARTRANGSGRAVAGAGRKARPLRSVHRPQAAAGAHRRRGATPAGSRAQPRSNWPSGSDARKQVFHDIDLFVAPSASLAREYVRLGLDERRIEVSDYGFSPQSPIPRDRPRSPLKIGFVGTMAWHKGAHVLIDAAGRLRGSFEVVIAGDPNLGPEYHARLKRAAEGLPVRFVGPFARSDVPRIYGGLDVLVVPSLWPENSPLVIHEAFMHKLPVVGSRLGGIPDLVDDGVNGLTYEAFSPEALALALQRFLDEPGLAESLASRAPAVKTITEDAHEWEARYDTLLSTRAPVSA